MTYVEPMFYIIGPSGLIFLLLVIPWPGPRNHLSIFGGLDAPGGPGNHSKRRGASHPAFSSGLWGPGAVQILKIVDFWIPEKKVFIIIIAALCRGGIENQELALELVCGADFWCNRHCKASPVVLEGFWGQVWPKIVPKPTRKLRIEKKTDPKNRPEKPTRPKTDPNWQSAAVLLLGPSGHKATDGAWASKTTIGPPGAMLELKGPRHGQGIKNV